MDYWSIFQSLSVIVINWGGTKLDNLGGVLKIHTFKQLVSHNWQIRCGVYTSCEHESAVRWASQMILVSEKSVAVRVQIIRTTNRHRCSGRVDQG
jgi:hypothetical protein